MSDIACPNYAECGVWTQDGLLCSRCTSRLRHALNTLPAAFKDLDLTTTRQAKTGGQTKRSRETPLPVNLDASFTSDDVVLTVATWIRELAERHGEDLDRQQLICHGHACVTVTTWAPGRTMREWCTWLAERMYRIRSHDAPEQIWDELMYCARMIEREVDRPPDQTYLCACAICGHPVFGPEHLDEVECRRCREVVGDEGYVPVYSRTEEKQRSREALEAEHVPAVDLRTAIRHVCGIGVNRKTLHSWITRGRLVAVEWKGDVPLYSVADAVKRANEIPVAARDLGDIVEPDREEQDHEAAYLKVLRVIQDAGGAA